MRVWCLRFGTVPSANDSTRKKTRLVVGPLPGGPGYLAELAAVGRAAGLHSVGVCGVEPLATARAAIESRIADDLVNGMQFVFRNPERSTDPARTVEGARSIIVGLRAYDAGDHRDDGLAVPAHVARYAWQDNVSALKESLDAVKVRLRHDGHRAVMFADDNSVVDRAVAHRAGLGWFGKNANILVPGAGSLFVIGCIVTTADLPAGTPMDDNCGTCTSCMPACPTGAIVSPGVIDANACLSWLLQKPGVFDRRHRAALGNRIYGCDDCQTSCPHVRRWSRTDGVDTDVRTSLDALGLLNADDEEVMRECDGWFVHDRNPVWIRRNALIIVGNTADPSDPRVRTTIGAYLQHGHEVLRAHAVWAAARLGIPVDGVNHDTSEMVRDELAHLPTLRDDL